MEENSKDIIFKDISWNENQRMHESIYNQKILSKCDIWKLIISNKKNIKGGPKVSQSWGRGVSRGPVAANVVPRGQKLLWGSILKWL